MTADPSTDPALEPAALAHTLEHATRGEWYVEETRKVWTLFAAQGEHQHPLQLIKAPKVSQEYATYWPNEHDATLIRLSSELARRYLAQLRPEAAYRVHRVTLGDPWTLTRLDPQDTLEDARRVAVRDLIGLTRPDLRGTGGEHFLEHLEDALAMDDTDEAWRRLNLNSQDFGYRYVIQHHP